MPVYDLSITDALLSTTRAVRKRLDFEPARFQRHYSRVPSAGATSPDRRQPSGMALDRDYRS